MRIVNLIRRLFRRAPRDVGLLQFVSPAAEPYVRPSVEEQIAAGHEYMQRYYSWLQQPAQPGDWATGGLVDPGGYDSAMALLSRCAPVTDRYGC